MQPSELWQAVLGELELKLSKANFTTWFKNTFISHIKEEEIVVGVPNAFTKAWLEKKYHRDILISLQNYCQTRVRSVVYRVEIRGTNTIVEQIENSAKESQEISIAPAFQQPKDLPGVSGDLTLNPKYTFESFIVGKQNELAHAAAQAVSTQPGGVYNPLFIYGGVGLGKTHLLQAVGNEILKKQPNSKILYVTSERFTSDYVHAIRTNRMNEFKNQYRTVDLLLIDDIQFITGKEGTQEEFFHTFNALHQNNKQIVLSSDRPPKAIPSLEQRLLSRFEWGMMADVGIPDLETRIAILVTKCRERGYQMEEVVLQYIADTIQSNIRELEGALNKVVAFHQFKNLRPTVETIKPILSSFQPTKTRKTITAKHLIGTVAGHYDLVIEDLLGKSREKRLAFPRQIIMFLMREEMKSSYPAIGAELGGRDHTTAMHAYGKIVGELEKNERLQHDMELIRQKLYAA